MVFLIDKMKGDLSLVYYQLFTHQFNLDSVLAGAKPVAQLMIRTLSLMPTSRSQWLFMLLLCLSLEGIALYYQYSLNYLPCVLCIHVRMLLAAIIVLSALALLMRQIPAVSYLLFGLTFGLWIWMTERSYMLLGTERGWIIGACSMESGLPSWLALEKWFPTLFHIHEPCGYTPFLVGRISMAEVLIVLSAAICLIMLVAFICGFFSDKGQTARRC